MEAREIQPNDLRIGNLLDYNVGDEVDPILEQNVIDWQDLKWVSERNKDFNMWHRPIPLTEEWLVRFGAEQNFPISSREYLLGDFIIINHYENGFLVKHKSWEVGKMVTYVHVLQNLIYTWDNTELTIK